MPIGLERLCAQDWVRAAPWQNGIQRIEAHLFGEPYAPHRHDTYSIGYTIKGVQSFDYRGVHSDSMPGQVIVLHPDEVHNGEAGTEEGFHYRMLYVEPSIVRRALGEMAHALPFVKNAVLNDPRLSCAIHAAFADMDHTLDTTALDDILTSLADGLLANDPSARRRSSGEIDLKAARIAREFLDANLDRTVTSKELESISGQDRFSLTRHFRRAYGTSPYRYLIMRRLDWLRAEISAGRQLADAAMSAGFSDQAHMSRHFKANYGISPGRWRTMVRSTKTQVSVGRVAVKSSHSFCRNQR